MVCGLCLQGESEDGYQVNEGKKDESKKNLSECEKETAEGGVELLAFAFGHGV